MRRVRTLLRSYIENRRFGRQEACQPLPRNPGNGPADFLRLKIAGSAAFQGQARHGHDASTERWQWNRPDLRPPRRFVYASLPPKRVKIEPLQWFESQVVLEAI